ncbi:hypothetical protein ACYSNR_06685 [Enterococcus sp. LJL128]|uniref:hypothetical protein n=1 Tax=Enterococcus sp. LJL51 TaxID=3416656 RepID=UPI003CE9F09D
MKNIQLISRKKYNYPLVYEWMEPGVYRFLGEDDLVDKGSFVLSMSFELEEELGEAEDHQYPLEDILDKYGAFVSEVIEDNNNTSVMKLELSTGDDLANIQKLKALAGRHVYNKERTENGQVFIDLMID